MYKNYTFYKFVVVLWLCVAYCMSQKSGYETMFLYMDLITEPFESSMPILAIKPSLFRKINI